MRPTIYAKPLDFCVAYLKPSVKSGFYFFQLSKRAFTIHVIYWLAMFDNLDTKTWELKVLNLYIRPGIVCPALGSCGAYKMSIGQLR